MLRKAAESDDIREAIKAIQVSPYDDLLQEANEVDGSLILGVELRLLRYLYKESLGVLMEFPLQASLLIAFFILKEMEIKDIVTVLAGRNMGLSQERIRSYMVTL